MWSSISRSLALSRISFFVFRLLAYVCRTSFILALRSPLNATAPISVLAICALISSYLLSFLSLYHVGQ